MATHHACQRRRWPECDDIRQEMRIRVWKAYQKDSGLGERTILRIVELGVVDYIRTTLGRRRNRPRIIRMSPRDWRSVAKKHDEASILDDIHEQLDGADARIFGMLREGHNAEEIGKAMGVSRNTAWRWSCGLRAKARSIARRLNG